ncbi:MAG: SIR2 family protein [Candidatus Peribacteria bacterium]|nr:SIR2 family protein [Candidatus Peribacteria bacterium]
MSKSHGNQLGVPSASELMDIFATKYFYIEKDSRYIGGKLRFEDACFMIKKNNGERELISILMREINKPIIRPLPAHNLLAKLPFSAYFSTNWDTLLEIACTNVNGNYPVIYEDEHVAMLKNGDIPIVKLHGCITNPKSIVASVDDYNPFSKTKPLMDAMTKVELARKTILFLGFNLEDKDFIKLYNDLYRILGEKFMGKHMAVTRNPTQDGIERWHKKGISLISGDLTDFLNDLALRARGYDNNFGNYDVKSTYLKELHNVTDCPTETMATNVFLEILKKEVGLGTLSAKQIVLDFEAGYKAVLEKKPNFCAFKSECDAISQALKRCEDLNEMLNYVKERICALNAVSLKINRHNHEVIKPSDSILIYSQSVRVATLLKSFTRDYQQSCTLYISECRPKCPSPFYDALHILKSLNDTGYKKTILL